MAGYEELAAEVARLQAETSLLTAERDDAEHRIDGLIRENAALTEEVKTWRWLHWDNPQSSWACPCGHAHGFGIAACDECHAPRPSKRAHPEEP